MAKSDDLPSYSPPELKTPEQTPEGFRMLAQNDMFPAPVGCLSGGCTLFIFSAFFLVPIGLFSRELLFDFLNLAKRIYQGELEPSNLRDYLIPFSFYLFIIFVFFVPIFMAIFRGICYSYKLSEQSEKFERTGELILSKYPLKLGESCQVRYRRLLKTGITLPETGHLKARLLCSEVVTYTVGTDDTTVRKIVFEKSLADQTLYRGTRSIEFEETLEIPSNSTPSFQAENNRILWEIEVKLDLPGLISSEKNPLFTFGSPTLSTFAFVVDPEVVRS